MTEPRLDPYATLGVARDASQAQIQQAYRRLAKRYHPDVHQSAQGTERMQLLNQAWAILSSPARRARHDSTESRPAAWRADAWSSAPRRARQGASAAGPDLWARAAGAQEGAQQPPRSPWLTVAITVVAAVALIWLVIGAALFGGLPLPFVGLVLFAVTRSAFSRGSRPRSF